METRKLARSIRSRIVGHEDVAPDQLAGHALNFRRHGGDQLEALRGSMAKLGWVKTVLVNKRTGYVIDGHARVEEALRQGLPTVPVTYVDLDEQEEKLALAVLDPITEMATRDQEQLNLLLADLQAADLELGDGLEALLQDLAGDGEEPGAGDGEGEGGEDEKSFNITYSLVFESLEEQEAWFKFLAELKERWPEIPTISGRVVKFLHLHPVRE
jgi:hypothetical protein